MKKIVFYKSASGKCPVEEFLDDLTSKQAQKIPKQAIKTAEKRMKDYLRRKKL